MLKGLKGYLEKANSLTLTIYAGVVSFLVYSCMYGFRKPFSATNYDGVDGVSILGMFEIEMDYKVFIVLAQLAGYVLSKFIGIKVVSEAGKDKRPLLILSFIGVAWLALLGFGAAPVGYKFLFLFLNGLPLGMIWGLVFSYLEGRRSTEAMGAMLCASFALASGFAKSRGREVIDMGYSEFWMPFITGAMYIVPLIIVVLLLDQLPDPSREDEAQRTKRVPMDKAARRSFFKNFAPGLVLLILVYMAITAFRDFRDNFMSNILEQLGAADDSGVFTQTELPVTLAVLLLLGLIMFIQNNKKALYLNHVIIIIGLLTAGISTYAFQQEWIGPLLWISLTGFATYAAYIPYNALLFERLIAAFGKPANAGFLIYMADSYGYLATVGNYLYKEFAQPNISYLDFFTSANYWLAGFGGILTLISLLYFWRKE